MKGYDDNRQFFKEFGEFQKHALPSTGKIVMFGIMSFVLYGVMALTLIAACAYAVKWVIG